MKAPITWTLINPESTIESEAIDMKAHPASLEGETVLFHWNAKHNGDIFLNQIADLLGDRIRNVKIVKSWEVAPDTIFNAGSKDLSRKIAKKLAAFKPDIVIGAQGD